MGGAYLAYKLVALFAEAAFARELTMNDAFWLNAQSIDSFRVWSLGTVEVIATVLFSVLLPFTLETALPLLIGIEVGLAAGMVEVWTQMSKYFNEEKQVFGYPHGD